jgi:hypothetical protein
MKARRHGRLVVPLAAGLAALLVPSSASAATQIGQTFAEGSCAANFTWLQGVSAPGGVQYAAPFDGIITSWSFQTNASAPQLRFKVGQPVGGNSFRIVGESGVHPTTANAVNTFPTQIAVQAGDVIGFYTVTGGAPCLRPATGYRAFFSTGDVPPGSAPPFGSEMQQQQLNIAATLETDCDGDGFGDETQDPSISSCHARALTLDANKNKVRKGKKVTLSGRIAETRQGGACAANQTVELQRKKPSQTAFTTIEQLQTDATGSFSAKERLNRTFQYRAQAAETPTCAAALSNTEKVKVKEKK